MALHDASALGFSQRPLGTRPVHVAREGFDADDYEAVLRLDDASVRVSGIEREEDGSYRGTVGAVEPLGASVVDRIAVGDRIAFRGLHVFTYAGLGTKASRPASQRSRDARNPAAPEPFDARADNRRLRPALLGSAAVALLGLGIGLGYVLSSGKDRPAPIKERAGEAREWRLKLDYALRSR